MTTTADTTTTLDDVKAFAAGLGPLAHLATVRSDGTPDVVPVHPAWEGDTLWAMVHEGTAKVRNIAGNPKVALHWQVGDDGDGVELWGTASVHTDLETKRRLWEGVFDYDLNEFAPGGPDAPGSAFIAVDPARAVIIRQFGMQGIDRWRR